MISCTLQQHIHRDVKPANILFDRHGNAFLGDFGIIKGLVADESDCQGNALTMPGFLVGTPNYVAPEIVMGRPFDGQADQYSLAMTVHEVLSGSNCMEGPTPSATVVNQTMVVPPALNELMPGSSGSPVRRNPERAGQESRPTASRIARVRPGNHECDTLGNVPADESALSDGTSRGAPGRVPCPACQAPIPVGSRARGGPRLLYPLSCHLAGQPGFFPDTAAQTDRRREAGSRARPQ